MESGKTLKKLLTNVNFSFLFRTLKMNICVHWFDGRVG